MTIPSETMVMAERESAAPKVEITDNSFRKSLYALEQWPSAIDCLRNQNHSPDFVSTFSGLLDRTVSELEVITSILGKQTKKVQNDEGKEKTTPPAKEQEDTVKKDESPAAGGDGKQQESPKRQPPELAPPADDASKQPVVKRARMKYTPLRKPSV